MVLFGMLPIRLTKPMSGMLMPVITVSSGNVHRVYSDMKQNIRISLTALASDSVGRLSGHGVETT